MATITTKYSKGDKVWWARTSPTEKLIECPDCLGTRVWTVRFANGEEVEAPCYTCFRGWEGSHGTIRVSEYEPGADALTIGQVRWEEKGAIYMCYETGIGSGTLYNEDRLYSTEAEAVAKSAELCTKALAHQAENQFKKKYDFANALSTFGYTRQRALLENRRMQKFLDLIKGVETK